MADEKEKAAPVAKGRGGGVLGMLLPAIVAGVAAFGGAKVAGAHHAAPAASEPQKETAKPPGPTLALDPFLLTVPDANKKAHPMKVTLAVEFEGPAKEGKEEEGFKSLVPRIRDSTLGYLRTMSFEEVLDAEASDKVRNDVLERVRAAGVANAQRVLITDLVVQ
jgi:flagellar basal body-associated protein FliL